MIYREAEKELQLLSAQFKAVAVTGPRQSGKTTLVKKVFKEKAYVNLENPDLRQFAREDPRGFLSNYPDGAILDEVQRVPELFSYLQQILDEKEQNGLFILTGSNNFLLNSNISQSLAGRVGYLFLLPLDIGEINPGANMSNQLIFKGGYPEIYQKDIDPKKYYDNYIRTYVERDVRLLKNITDLYTFERFLRLCAGRTGQLLNMSSLAADVGVDVKTIGSWLGVLEASFIAFRLYPYHENYNKRIVKMPKLYFYDTGLASALMGIEDVSQLTIHPLRGGLFENLVVVDFLKRLYNNGKQNNLYFWRDNIGNEVDLLIKKGANRYPVEIKSAQTISDEFFKGIRYWNKLTNTEGGYLVYAGDMLQKRSGEINIVPVHLLNTIEI
ncbi:ATP-binding protein [Seramator thermalis]|uniref:ATP-binding protein n=1 Tax=Seramator thermalis TaxID=2496270 RepID=UPI00101C6A58|nr:ATP-binding protein [Seramator thermalis]